MGAAAEDVEVAADESAMGAEGKLGLVFWAHQFLSPLGPFACKQRGIYADIAMQAHTGGKHIAGSAHALFICTHRHTRDATYRR